MKRWKTWAEVKASKSKRPSPKYLNSQLLQKAVEVAIELNKLPFVLAVGLFGSAARGEDGHDVDLLVIDDGTLSNPALSAAEKVEATNQREGSVSSYNTLPAVCLELLAEHIPLTKDFWGKIYRPPMCIHIVFVNNGITTSQSNLDRLIRCGRCFEFWNNVQQDLRFFYPSIDAFPIEKLEQFRYHFVNNGNPSAELMKEINEDLKLQQNTPVPRKPVKASPESKLIKVPVVPVMPDNTFEVIGGQAHAKYEVMGLASALKDPGKYAKWGTKPPRGIMLYGPPGTGKTLLAKALSKATNTPFYEIDASQIITKWYGESAQNVDRVFEKARNTGGIIFFDEADSLVSNRNGDNSHEESRRVVAALCRNMDGFKTSDKVVVFFATNRPEDMDEAVKRAGRTDLWIEVPLPDREGRREIFNIHIRKAEGLAGRKLFSGVDFDLLLEKSEGYSGADVAEIIRRSLEAKVRAEAEGENPVAVTNQDVLDQITRYERVRQAKKKIGF